VRGGKRLGQSQGVHAGGGNHRKDSKRNIGNIGLEERHLVTDISILGQPTWGRGGEDRGGDKRGEGGEGYSTEENLLYAPGGKNPNPLG